MLPKAPAGPYGVSAGPDGGLWFTVDKAPIGRITPDGDITEFPLPNKDARPQTIISVRHPAVEPSVWFTDWALTSSVRLLEIARSPSTTFRRRRPSRTGRR